MHILCFMGIHVMHDIDFSVTQLRCCEDIITVCMVYTYNNMQLAREISQLLLTATIMSLTDVTTLFTPLYVETDSMNSTHNLAKSGA